MHVTKEGKEVLKYLIYKQKSKKTKQYEQIDGEIGVCTIQ